MNTTELSLYKIDETLAQLLSLREEMAAEGEDTAAVEQQIGEYMQALPEKVSGVCAIFRMWRSQVNAIKAEESRLADLRRRIEAHEERLKTYVAEILERQPEPKKGCKKLVGVDGSALMLKGNGGLQPLEIHDPVRIPDEFCKFRLLLSHEDYSQLLHYAQIHGWDWSNHPDAEVICHHDYVRIREALEKPCPTCRPMISHGTAPGGECPTCGGTGKAGVPGAALLERGKHVEIR